MNDDENIANCLVGTGLFFCFEGLQAALSAATGALGYGILSSANGWHVAEFTCATMTQAQTVGGVILGCPVSCCLASRIDIDSNAYNTSLASIAVSGALDGMLGAKILGFLTSGQQLGYAAAAGATGSAVLVSSIVGLVLVVGGPILCFAANTSGEPVLVQIPGENVQNGEIQSFQGATLIDPSTVGINVNSLEDFAQQITEMRQNQDSNHTGQPNLVDGMDRNNLNRSLLNSYV